MIQSGVPYYDLLMRLADFQTKMGTPIRFRFRKEKNRPDGRALMILNPVLDQSAVGKTLPLFTYSGFEPLEDWSNTGYILILDGRISRGEGEFLLTSKTILLSQPY